MDIVCHLPFGKSIQVLKEACKVMMHKCINADNDVHIRDLASYLLAPDPKTEKKIPIEDLENDAIVAVQGGSDNTSTALVVIFYFLMVHRYYFDALRKELNVMFPNPTAVLDPSTLMGIRKLGKNWRLMAR
ncbi:hypothetical protein M422DRAFT_273095 [Sphaerobolus stellatus SS14]|uniref:Cytochrome P450 n=1 Tax=Sphaerobolus stellatus (strain SS14) TaxID=990650 RepID=A0A0C9UA39_SPHS4|nr:hypothetical protein M422DRAFT_273095 [Sphaerobolus stellatus SS14]